jgi:hypothetical protein
MKNPGQASCPSTFFPKTPHTGTYIPYIHIIPINFHWRRREGGMEEKWISILKKVSNFFDVIFFFVMSSGYFFLCNSKRWLVRCNILPFPLGNMPGRKRRPSVLKTSSWSNKRLLKQDDTLQTFHWPHDTDALIDEMKHMSEIVFSLSLPSLPLSKYCVCSLSL